MEKRSFNGSKPTLHPATKAKKKGNNASGSQKRKSVDLDIPKRTSLLDILHNQDDCNCELVAKAVTSNVHTNLDLSGSRKNSRDLDKKEVKEN